MVRLTALTLGSLAFAALLVGSVDAQPERGSSRFESSLTSFLGDGVNQLDISLKPNYGELTLKAGFANDPRTINVTAGGNLTVVYKGVTTHVTKQPDFKVHYTAGRFPLTFYTESSGETSLLINTPDGKWHIDDDSGKGLNAKIKFNNPKSGRYDVYVGTFRAQLERKTKLKISELK